MTQPNRRIMGIAEAIDRYLKAHPKAADTATGIRGWWFANRKDAGSPEEVQAALDHLIERGSVVRTILADGTVIYSRGASKT